MSFLGSLRFGCRCRSAVLSIRGVDGAPKRRCSQGTAHTRCPGQSSKPRRVRTSRRRGSAFRTRRSRFPDSTHDPCVTIPSVRSGGERLNDGHIVAHGADDPRRRVPTSRAERLEVTGTGSDRVLPFEAGWPERGSVPLPDGTPVSNTKTAPARSCWGRRLSRVSRLQCRRPSSSVIALVNQTVASASALRSRSSASRAG